MRIVTFSIYADARLGAFTDKGVVDLAQACSKYSNAGLIPLFSDTKTFLAAGDLATKIANEVVDASLEETPALPEKGGTLLKANQVRLLAPILNPQKIYCPAVNYAAHGAESGVEAPSTPYIFTKFGNALVGSEAPIIYPKMVQKMDMEAELAIVIGRSGKYIAEHQVYSHIAGYTALNDISYRDLQNAPGLPNAINPYGKNWVKGKGLDTSCPLGPYIVTSDEIGEPYPLKITGRVNGETIQEGNTKEMVHNVSKLVSYISQGITLEPGDVISTGVPSRVKGIERNYLKVGDVVEVEIERVGVLKNHVVAE